MLEKFDAKRVENRPSTFMKKKANKPDENKLKSFEIEVMESFNNSVYRYDIEYNHTLSNDLDN